MNTIEDFKSNSSLKLCVFSSISLVSGAKYSLLCDMHRSTYLRIPNEVFNLFKSIIGKSYDQIVKNFNEKEINDFLSELMKRDFVFFTISPELFPEINISWEWSGLLSNVLIDYDKSSHRIPESIYSGCVHLGAEAIEIRYFYSPTLNELSIELNKFKLSGFRSIELSFKFDSGYKISDLKKLFRENKRVKKVIIHSHNTNKIAVFSTYSIIFATQVVTDENHCGAISRFGFNINLKMYMESNFHNSCLNKKLSIDKRGFIKNCPSMSQSYGHFSTIKDLSEVILNSDFRSVWDIKKDQIDVCKDCEFRHICTDCRAYLPENEVYNKPKKCGYDPYAGEWNSLPSD